MFCFQGGRTRIVNGKDPRGREKFQLLEGMGDKRREKGVEVAEMVAGEESIGGGIILIATGRKELGQPRGDIKGKLSLLRDS